MQKITYEHKGVKITIESECTASEVEVAEAILIAHEKLPKVFSKINLNNLISYQDVIPTVLVPKDLENILKISQKKSYDLVKEGMDKDLFPVMKFDRVYKISKKGFLTWLLGYESSDLSDGSFKVFTSNEIQEILSICQKTTYDIINQASIHGWFEVKKIGSTYRIPAAPFLRWMDQLDSLENRFNK